ncbi:sensor histidine kinase [Solimicrobium silvestre]|uniref:histidine kinase n=1 Tax=Solimicrobium silvestre TaxID=2099400 RepID=A0A2S9H095_9BURK|nr:ATP-binding protein [Solimicrobium silvestre]PRC93370.1 Histidine kinase-, DNA gyrase B-, and HSP90-like ATPase [Solimicrobium silvestre]
MRPDFISVQLINTQGPHLKLTLTSKLMAAVLLAFAMLCTGDYLISYRTLESTVLKNILTTVSQSSQLINAAVASAANGHENKNGLHTLQTFFSEMLTPNGNSGIVYIAVLRADGTVIMNTSATQVSLPAPDLPENYAAAAKRGMLHVRDNVLLENNEVGFLQYGLATGDLMEAMAQSQRNSLILTTIVILLSFVALSLFGLKITRQLSALKHATQEIADGHYELKMPEIGDDELGEVAHNFNLMSEAIAAKVREVSTLNHELEQRVDQRTSDLHLANQKLEENIKELESTRDSLVKSEKLASLGAIVAGVAHEINTPIGNALVTASTIREIVDGFSAQAATGKMTHSALNNFLNQCKEGSHLVEHSLARASELIQSFKQVAVDQSSERRRSFNLAEMVRETITTLRHIYKNTNFTLENDIQANIVMDSFPGALGQVITNLLNNALIHGFEGREQGKMLISAERLVNNSVRICFSDNGNGIAVSNLKRIFDPFFTTKFGQGGSGLGLNVVDNIVHRILGGSVYVDSQIGFGTIFTIEIPLNAPFVEAS